MRLGPICPAGPAKVGFRNSTAVTSHCGLTVNTKNFPWLPTCWTSRRPRPSWIGPRRVIEDGSDRNPRHAVRSPLAQRSAPRVARADLRCPRCCASASLMARGCTPGLESQPQPPRHPAHARNVSRSFSASPNEGDTGWAARPHPKLAGGHTPAPEAPSEVYCVVPREW